MPEIAALSTTGGVAEQTPLPAGRRHGGYSAPIPMADIPDTRTPPLVVNHTRRNFLFKTGSVLVGGVLGGLLVGRAKAAAPKHLRPPGAGGEDDFLAACIRCGQCSEACPTDVLRTARASSGVALGTPFVVPFDQPCDLCEGRDQMECIAACPTAALLPCDRHEVRMGMAVINEETCLPYIGVSCKACWHACPFPNEAILFDELGRAVVGEEACVGCGLCEHACLTVTDIPAITIVPQAEWEKRGRGTEGDGRTEQLSNRYGI